VIPVPQSVLESLAGAFGTTGARLSHFAGGRQDNDGVIYAYPYENKQRLLKIMAIPAQEQRTGLFRLEERLRFMHFLGKNGAPIAARLETASTLSSPQDNCMSLFCPAGTCGSATAWTSRRERLKTRPCGTSRSFEIGARQLACCTA
jgi:hypothetical protein